MPGSARQALTRLRFIAQLADTSSDLPLSALNNLVTESIDIVVYCERNGNYVGVSEIIAIEDLQGGVDASSFTTTSLFAREAFDQPLKWTGNLPSRSLKSLQLSGYDIRSLQSVFDNQQTV